MLYFTPDGECVCAVVFEFAGQLATLMRGERTLKVNNSAL